MIVSHNKCTGCHACFSVCPVNAISMYRDYAGFLYPNINEKLCIDCNLCVRICPVNKIIRSDTIVTSLSKAFACININESIRYQSSSGGAFTALAEHVIENGGVVFGASFDLKFDVSHDYSETVEGLNKFRGSKYVESTIDLSFLKAKEFLQAEKSVLFSGTPCQIEGLLSFLGKGYDKLITVDLICHGVASPMIWQKYIRYRNKEYGMTPEAISFRDKKIGWEKFCLSFKYPNEREYCSSMDKDLYMQLFLNNLCLRESCYRCKFKTIHRKSDITIADFWGIEQINPELYDNRGCSLVIVHSMKGERLIIEISNKADLVAVDLERAISNNKNAIKSARKPILRRFLVKYILYNNFTFVEIITKCYNFGKRLTSKSIDILNRIMKAID